MIWFENSDSSKNDGFSLSKKIVNRFKKKLKFHLLIDFNMKNRLNDLNRSFLT
jgi:hypothetical protein